MAKELSFSMEMRPLLEDLVRQQDNLIKTREQGDEILARIHEIDLNNTLNKLKITPCSICFHGGSAPVDKCQIWSKCQSTIKIEKVFESEGLMRLCLSLNFQVI